MSNLLLFWDGAWAVRLLLIHADYINFRAREKALKTAEEVKEKEQKVEECLVVFSAAEKTDEGKEEVVAHRAASQVKDDAGKLKAGKIVVYPFVHLTDEPARPESAMKLLDLLVRELQEYGGLQVWKAPFGYYKEFELKCKGHPLAELSRRITGEEKEEVSEALKAEEKARSYWYILDQGGVLHEVRMSGDVIEGYDFSEYPNLEKFARYEMKKVRAVKQEPPHVRFMRELELADYEPGSDPGNLRYYPKGRLIKSLLEYYVTKRVIDYGGVEIETPIMYDFEHPTLKKYLNRFPARQYVVQSPNKKLFLRFAACFGQFLTAHDAIISYKNLPLRLYELARYAFRAEQRGELTGLRRLRAFTMPDCHALCSDIPQAKEEMMVRFKFQKQLQTEIGFRIPEDFELAVRVTRDFWEENKDFVVSLVREWGKPALVEMWDKRFFYFVLKYEWNFVDALGKASALNTDQIDVENGERYDIRYTDKDGSQKHPIILHMSPSGAIERVMYAMLEKAYYAQQAGKKPMLPLWLSPTQVRIIPVSEKQLEHAKSLLPEFEGVRADLDDTDETLGKKIRKAEKEWVPYIAVVGEKEASSGALSVRVRETGEQKQMTVQELAGLVKEKTKGMPFKKLSLPALLSKRPIFVG